MKVEEIFCKKSHIKIRIRGRAYKRTDIISARTRSHWFGFPINIIEKLGKSGELLSVNIKLKTSWEVGGMTPIIFYCLFFNNFTNTNPTAIDTKNETTPIMDIFLKNVASKYPI